jgi:outer membrane immunogenic protein
MTQSFSRIALAMLATAAVAAPAAAQDARNFNGPFAGVQLGWQQDRQSLETSTVPQTVTRASGDGFAYGGQIGYDATLGSSFVLGVEGSITGRTGTNRFPTFDLEAGRTINATARAGWLITPEGLLYARGGYSNARFNIRNPNGPAETRDGYLLGVGYEQILARNVSARVEYNYSNYGNDSLPGLGGPATLNYHRHAVMTGLNFRF